jgi:hypothetical protein
MLFRNCPVVFSPHELLPLERVFAGDNHAFRLMIIIKALIATIMLREKPWKLRKIPKFRPSPPCRIPFECFKNPETQESPPFAQRYSLGVS